MIHLNTVDFSYDGGHRALKGVSLHVPEGALLGLAGPNGSGKSTLLSLVAGLQPPCTGELRVAGRVSPGREGSIRDVCRLVMQDADLQILGGTVEEDLLIGRKRTDLVETAARGMAERFHLTGHWNDPVQTLSWGTKRKLCLASALLDGPRILLLDEPFSGLDYPGVLEMRAILAENKRHGLTQVVSSHDLESFVDLADSLAVLDQGELVLNGKPEEVLGHVLEHGVRPPCSWLHSGTILPWDQPWGRPGEES